MRTRAVLGDPNDSTSDLPAIFNLYWKRLQDFNRLRGMHLTEIQTELLKRTVFERTTRAGSKGGSPGTGF